MGSVGAYLSSQTEFSSSVRLPAPTKPLTYAWAAAGGVELTSGTVGRSAAIRSWAFSQSVFAVGRIGRRFGVLHGLVEASFL